MYITILLQDWFYDAEKIFNKKKNTFEIIRFAKLSSFLVSTGESMVARR